MSLAKYLHVPDAAPRKLLGMQTYFRLEYHASIVACRSDTGAKKTYRRVVVSPRGGEIDDAAQVGNSIHEHLRREPGEESVR